MLCISQQKRNYIWLNLSHTGKEYTAAVESKQVAQQEAQRAQFLVEKAKQERQQRVVQAEGEAEAAKMISFVIFKTSGAISRFSTFFNPTARYHIISKMQW